MEDGCCLYHTGEHQGRADRGLEKVTVPEQVSIFCFAQLSKKITLGTEKGRNMQSELF